MPGNSFGHAFRFTTWGESHGPQIGCVVDGVPPKIELSEEDLQYWLDRRRPGRSRYTTQRQEADLVKIVSGVFEGYTTGTPIGLIICNEDQRSRDYSEIKNKLRPAHADYTYRAKYGIRDYRGGGRASTRETAMRVAAGAVARKILGEKIKIRGALVQIGDQPVKRGSWDWDEVEKNPFWCPDADVALDWAETLTTIRKKGLSLGAMIEGGARGVPAGWGEPVFDKLDADLAKGMLSLPACKGFEVGSGFSGTYSTGSEHNDPFYMKDGSVRTETNNSGGIQGGISNGENIVFRAAFKPTATIMSPQKTVDVFGNDVEMKGRGRHDPCVLPRAVPIVESMAALVLADHALRHRGQVGS